MSEADARALIISALQSANIPGLIDMPEIDAFATGNQKVAFDELQMDSLAVMEFCIALELDTGLSLSPEDLHSFETLNNLAKAICVK